MCHHGGDLLPGELIGATPVIRAPLLVETLPNPGQVLLRANDHYRRSGHGSVEGLQLTWCDELRWPGDPAGRELPGRRVTPKAGRAPPESGQGRLRVVVR